MPVAMTSANVATQASISVSVFVSVAQTSNASVFHEKFGYGRVTSADGNKLEIAFEKAGNKKVIDNFVRPA